jgi:hypothetical protein
MAGVGTRTPIWITENGVPTGATMSEAGQASALTQLVAAVRAYSGTFNVTDYRWFNLRDANSSASGSLPGAATTFATDGLLRDDYTPKPSYSAYQAAIAADGSCTATSLRVGLRRERQGVREVTVFLGRQRVGRARGARLRSVRVWLGEGFPPAFGLRIVMRLRGGRTVSYRRRFQAEDCRVVPR